MNGVARRVALGPKVASPLGHALSPSTCPLLFRLLNTCRSLFRQRPSERRQAVLLPTLTTTLPCGVFAIAFLVTALTCTRTVTGRPATGWEATAVMAVVVGANHLKLEVPSTATHEAADEHETASREVPASMLAGDDHLPEP